jgi:hypothetical protein
MSTRNRLIYLGTIAALLLTAAGYGRHEAYQYEHGGRLDRYGHREAGWCEHHREDVHCR